MIYGASLPLVVMGQFSISHPALPSVAENKDQVKQCKVSSKRFHSQDRMMYSLGLEAVCTLRELFVHSESWCLNHAWSGPFPPGVC